MVIIDLGTKVISVNQSLLKDYDLLGDIEIPLPADDADEPVQDGSASFATALWQSVSKGSIDFLELFSGSARLSQSAPLTGLRVGAPVDLRSGFDLSTRSGQQNAMEIKLEQKPDRGHTHGAQMHGVVYAEHRKG